MRGRLAGLLLILLLSIAGAETMIPRIDFDNASIVDIVAALGKSSGCSLIFSGDPTALQGKRATIHLKEVPLEEALGTILSTNGLCFEKQGEAYLISSLPQDLNNSGYTQKTERLTLKYLPAVRAVELLSKVFPTAIFQEGERSAALLCRGKKTELEEARRLLAKIDLPQPQILIESRIVELSQSDSTRLGISYGNGTIRFMTADESKKTGLSENLSSALNALIAEGRANVIASPRIATLDNKEAVINIGSRVPYAVPVGGATVAAQWTVEYLDAGIKLKVLPQIGEKKEITTWLQPEVSSIAEWRTTAAGDFPVIAARSAAATVRVKNGETIVIGGLTSEIERKNVVRVPFLGFLPIVGALFQNTIVEKEKTEIVFMVTPRII
ncbi:MAG: hypothetical protein ABIH56_00430 [Candidatus Margulisiibacteriota bacterium]